MQQNASEVVVGGWRLGLGLGLESAHGGSRMVVDRLVVDCWEEAAASTIPITGTAARKCWSNMITQINNLGGPI